MIKIDLHYKSDEPGQVQVYKRCNSAFAKRGMHLRFHSDIYPSLESDADLFVLQQYFLPEDPDRLKRAIIIEERADSSMPIVRDALSFPSVKHSFKVSLVKREWINLPVERPHTWILDPKPTWEERPLLKEESIDKIHPGFHFGMYPCMHKWVQRARYRGNAYRWSDRPIDVLFMGATNFSVPLVGDHRLSLCREIRELRNLNIVCTTKRAVPVPRYFEICQHAKIIVSPWGYGELCYRDFEAILDGCVLIKPRTDFIQTLGNILQENITYLPCEANGTDLQDIVRSALSQEKLDLEEMRRYSLELVSSWWDEDKLVDWWCQQTGIC